jgi:hypothetical protein
MKVSFLTAKLILLHYAAKIIFNAYVRIGRTSVRDCIAAAYIAYVGKAA